MTRDFPVVIAQNLPSFLHHSLANFEALDESEVLQRDSQDFPGIQVSEVSVDNNRRSQTAEHLEVDFTVNEYSRVY